ncbi:unnamed protein product [Vitrella brassicaformis CCMP3155]|uniref:Apple domain-containing protein n=1 Tax=Vitrella brassicaformis (strain CCMP3155) TaxID=1169540 RepID=A0A0G4EXT2_VITBC|nr:unnamed protein product [Vitrella brassicaformis CCMP3155]|eukprot:CEM03628.1 unnamed protein product [Vitrella brassicaformis CCMP3155]
MREQIPFYKEVDDTEEDAKDNKDTDGDDPDHPFARRNVTTVPGSAQLIQAIPSKLMGPRQCQLFCQAENNCTYFTVEYSKCWLWGKIERWEDSSKHTSGPRLCAEDKLAVGLRCDSSFYRQRYTALSLFVLKVKNIRVPFGDGCPVEISWASLSWILAVAVLLLATLIIACISRARYEKRTNVVRVMIAAVAMWDFLTDCAFVARSWDKTMLWVFWVGLFHLVLVVLANSLALIWFIKGVGKQGTYFRRWFDKHRRHSHMTFLLVFVSSFLHLGVLHLFASRLFGWRLFSLQVHTQSLLTLEMLTLAEDVPQVALQVSYVLLKQGGGGRGIPSVTLVSVLTSVFQVLKVLLFGLKYILASVFPIVAVKSARSEAAISLSQGADIAKETSKQSTAKANDENSSQPSVARESQEGP